MMTSMIRLTRFTARIRAGPQARAGPGPPARAGPRFPAREFLPAVNPQIVFTK